MAEHEVKIHRDDLISNLPGILKKDPELLRSIVSGLKDEGSDKESFTNVVSTESTEDDRYVEMNRKRLIPMILGFYSIVVLAGFINSLEIGMVTLWGGLVLMFIIASYIFPTREDMELYTKRIIRAFIRGRSKKKKVKKLDDEHTFKIGVKPDGGQ